MRATVTVLAAVLITGSPASAYETVTWQSTFERLMGGKKVDAAQISGSQQQTQEVDRRANEAAAATEAAQMISLRQMQAKEKLDFYTGQGLNACMISSGREAMSSADVAQKKLADSWSAGEAGWTRTGGQAQGRAGISLEMRKVAYCSAAERAAHICDGGVGQQFEAADSDASVWMLRRQNGLDDTMMAADFVDLAAPMPTIEPNPETVQAELRLWSARRQAAAMTAARRSIIGVPIGGMGGENVGR